MIIVTELGPGLTRKSSVNVGLVSAEKRCSNSTSDAFSWREQAGHSPQLSMESWLVPLLLLVWGARILFLILCNSGWEQNKDVFIYIKYHLLLLFNFTREWGHILQKYCCTISDLFMFYKLRKTKIVTEKRSHDSMRLVKVWKPKPGWSIGECTWESVTEAENLIMFNTKSKCLDYQVLSTSQHSMFCRG